MSNYSDKIKFDHWIDSCPVKKLKGETIHDSKLLKNHMEISFTFVISKVELTDGKEQRCCR